MTMRIYREQAHVVKMSETYFGYMGYTELESLFTFKYLFIGQHVSHWRIQPLSVKLSIYFLAVAGRRRSITCQSGAESATGIA